MQETKRKDQEEKSRPKHHEERKQTDNRLRSSEDTQAHTDVHQPLTMKVRLAGMRKGEKVLDSLSGIIRLTSSWTIFCDSILLKGHIRVPPTFNGQSMHTNIGYYCPTLSLLTHSMIREKAKEHIRLAHSSYTVHFLCVQDAFRVKTSVNKSYLYEIVCSKDSLT